ncbi:MAG: Hsp20/alpha crystallin family protein [Gammaproteobacteria bacterium]|nr:Hsp20/alpha crystallin family protein [Gammaproteobacteria bacterium]NIR88934.1 Hsp20/alpha crystallin family protein [Gammaproteobacteria bacterium]NIU05223.1 Hsp20/alpha crystallin family protein [Gammaproteobacteria bacterium]NIV52838.1 Hsp20 family protein [Gammaproteobacteria bacterium]NIW85134.1 Hsp20 family protein [Gammaproteobacteria bacterium]
MAKETTRTEAEEPAAAPDKEVEVHREPARALSAFEDMDRLFESFFPRGWLRPFRVERPLLSELWGRMEGVHPRVDVIDRDDEVMVRAEIPGVDKRHLDVSLTDNTVTIKRTVSREEKEEKGQYFRREISRGMFSRTIGLPADVEGGKAKAKFKDGVLELTIPKVQKSKRRHVPID